MDTIYHVLSRGADKRKIFLDDQDYLRFIHDLFEFNDQQPISNVAYRFNASQSKSIVTARPYIEKAARIPRKLLVNIHAFCLMPNHYHLLLSPLVENGLSVFMKKLNMGYARYFNEKNQREGVLFQGRFKRILVTEESHLIHLPYYIHLNPLDLKAPEWRERKLNKLDEVIKFLDSYRWSSHLDYCGQKNFPSATQREFLLQFFGGTNNYSHSLKEWLETLNLESVGELMLEG